ncbi:hypothetical protein [uncultured Dokdonia sp.]|uniref:hypothetical protein n=1 Tax=uncultured Dokdonia sp. TaxID=575653 RepID=UPI002628B5EA|nr:hypothetical protein [uncultured Dokdonia sp.]
MNVDLEYAPEIIVREVIPEILEIKQDHINILGNHFLVLIDEEGNFKRINNILLDESSSFKFTQLLWNFAFVHVAVHKSKGQFGHTDASIKIRNTLEKILTKLEVSNCIYDITTLIQYMEIEGAYIKNLL